MPGLALDTLVGDMAYSDGDIRAGAEARGVDLVAKVPPVTDAGRYPKPTSASTWTRARSLPP